MPKDERLVDPTPELMRLRIISVAALNCGTYLGGDSVIETSVAVAATDVLELEPCCASIVPRGCYRNRGSRRIMRASELSR